MLVIAGCSGGLMLGMLLGFGLELKRGCLLGEWELPGNTPILGRVPPIHLGKVRHSHKMPSIAPRPSPTRVLRRPRITLRVRRPRRSLVLAPTILLCVLGAIIVTIYNGWSPF
jgi:hypothetical protein